MTGAMSIAGYDMTVEEVFCKISRDRQYWGSGGGVTLTGGEPFLQPEFTKQLLEMCYNAWIHTAVETCGNTAWENLEASIPFLDWIFFDLKQMDQNRLERITSSVNCFERIVSNARKLTELFRGRLLFRMPLIAGVNDQNENIEATIRFLKETGTSEINILPGHHLGREKFASLGLPYYTNDVTVPSLSSLSSVREIFTGAGITCYIGSDTPF
jgi:glycyl-radical enzyme activating protein